MSPNSRILYRLLIAATGINVVGLPIAIVMAEPWHATVHAVLALAGGFWAMRLRHRRADRLDLLERLEGAPSDQREVGAGEQADLDNEWLRRQEAYDRERRQE